MKKVVGAKVGTTLAAVECPLPPPIQEALGELVGAAREGLLALSVGVGLGVVHELMELEVDEVVGPKGKHNASRTANSRTTTRAAMIRSRGSVAASRRVGHSCCGITNQSVWGTFRFLVPSSGSLCRGMMPRAWHHLKKFTSWLRHLFQVAGAQSEFRDQKVSMCRGVIAPTWMLPTAARKWRRVFCSDFTVLAA